MYVLLSYAAEIASIFSLIHSIAEIVLPTVGLEISAAMAHVHLSMVPIPTIADNVDLCVHQDKVVAQDSVSILSQGTPATAVDAPQHAHRSKFVVQEYAEI